MAAPMSPAEVRSEPDWVPFVVSVDLESGTVTVGGEFDREHAQSVLDGLAALAPTGHARWTLDAQRVTFCDAAGLRTLVTGHHLARRHGRELVIHHPAPCLHRLLRIAGLDGMLGLVPHGAGALSPTPRRPPPSGGPSRGGARGTTVPAPAAPAD